MPIRHLYVTAFLEGGYQYDHELESAWDAEKMLKRENGFSFPFFRFSFSEMRFRAGFPLSGLDVIPNCIGLDALVNLHNLSLICLDQAFGSFSSISISTTDMKGQTNYNVLIGVPFVNEKRDV